MSKKGNIQVEKYFVLEDESLSYIVENGQANVFIAEFQNDEAKFRLFLREVKKGDAIPGLNSNEEDRNYRLFLVNSTRDKNGSIQNLELSTKNATSKEKLNFVNKIDKYVKDSKYVNDLIQFYLLNQAKDWRNIYSSFSSTKRAQNASFKKIYDTFEKSSFINTRTLNTNNLYFAFEKVARSLRIMPVEFTKLNSEQRSNMSVESLSNWSGCICRKVLLDAEWWTKDNGPLIAFYGKDKDPVACVFKRNCYYMYKSDKEVPIKISKKVAYNLAFSAYVLYRTFPETSLNYKNVISFIRSSLSIRAIINTVLIGLVVTLLGMLTPILNQFLYDTLIPADDYAGIYGLCTIMIAILIGSGCFSLVKGYLSLSIVSKLKYALQVAFFDRIFKLKQSFISKFEPADLSMRILGISNVSTSLATKIFATFITLIFSVFYLFQMNNFMPSLFGVALLLTLIMFAILIVFSRIQYKWYSQSIQVSIDKSSLLFQLIRGISKLRVAGAEDRAINKYIDKHLQSTKLNYNTGFYATFVAILATVFSIISSMVFFSIITANGLLSSVGNIMGFMTSYGIFASAIYQIPNCYMSYLQAKPWFERLVPILKEEPDRNLNTRAIENITGKIEVSHLSFAYDKNSPVVLNDVSFTVNPGEYLAIVGPSGCGKSTLLSLLLGFEHQDKGKIYYDNHDLDDIDKKSLRQNFGVVLQDGDLISGSILDNIVISNPDATMDDVNEVLKKVGLYDEVLKMPMGVHTLLSEGSGLISGGQKQRILIARAIVGNPKIMFFDEATSALDNITQTHVCSSLDKIGGTRVVIAHRLSTIINCDRIIVMEKGKIIETGTYNELIKNKGLFYNLVQRQIS